MVLDYEITVDNKNVRFKLKKIDSEAIAALPSRSDRKGILCHQSGCTLVYSDHVIIGGRHDDSDSYNFLSAAKAKKFAADVTKAIELLVKTSKKGKTSKAFDISEHFEYNFKFEPKGNVIFTVKTQSSDFTKFVASSKNPVSTIKTCAQPEIRGYSDILYIKGDSSEKTASHDYSDAKRAAAAINKYTEKLQKVIAAFTVHMIGSGVVKYPVKQWSGTTIPMGVSFLYDTQDKVIHTIIRTGASTQVVGKASVFWPRCVYLSKTQAVKPVAELLSENIVPPSSDFRECSFL